MVDPPGGRGQRDPNVIRLSHQYAACPSCQLILPLYDDPDGWPGDHAGAAHPGAVPPTLQVARCGLCKRPLDTATPWPLDLKLRCPDCGALIRAPAEAAVLACSGCDSYFANPGNSPEVGQQVRAILRSPGAAGGQASLWPGRRPWPYLPGDRAGARSLPEGDKRSVVEVEADEVAPSLRWATAKPERATNSKGKGEFNDEPPF